PAAPSTCSSISIIRHGFLLNSSPPPVALYPFPTRRSSDLQAFCADERTARVPCDRRSRLFVGNGPATHVVHDVARLGRHQHAARDRKSTRLNSSHGSISYAVFCLKKKNKRRPSPE